jgi:exonuclease SbcC
MKDFIAHRDTRLQFCKGVTVFVGHNGSGKSSVIDAITFALFGKHTRKHGKNLVRRGGNNSSLVDMHFTLNSKEFRVTRVLNAAGGLASSQFELVSDSGRQVNKKIAGGERRTLGGESMSDEIAKVLGLDYDRLRIAAVVQQGELVRIIEASPKEFKELLNSLIGIDRLDRAFKTMSDVMQGFRDRLRDELGYSYDDMAKVEDGTKQSGSTLAQAEAELTELVTQERKLLDKAASLDKEIDRLAPLQEKVAELQRSERLLLQHAIEARDSLSSESARLERLTKTAKSSISILADKTEVDMRLKMVAAELEEVQCKLVENEGQIGRLRAMSEVAGKLKITDGKCPVCNSPVLSINKVLDCEHLDAELKAKSNEKARLLTDRMTMNKEKAQLEAKSREIDAAGKFLSASAISSSADIDKLETHLEDTKTRLAQLAPLTKNITQVGNNPLELAVDGFSKTIAEQIVTLRQQTKGFSSQQFSNAKLERAELARKLQKVNEDKGRYQKAKEDAESAIKSFKQIADQLKDAYNFARLLEQIKSNVFNRDGPIGLSLRSWALQMISAKASEYAMLFNIGISRIELSEKARDVNILCYGRHGEIDMDSMSGGEKVAIALALRLGIAYMMGSSKLDFIILDEPTAHLDEERRKALVRIVSEAFREGSGPLAQLIIITHDAEIFEDAEVDQVLRFKMTAEGSHVNPE